MKTPIKKLMTTRLWRLANPARVKQQRKTYYQSHLEQERISKLHYNSTHKVEWAMKQKQRRQIDVEFRLSTYLRNRLYKATKRNSKSGSAIKDLGCTMEFFRKYLEARFQSGMTWDNYGKWHIDHIKPLSRFDLTDRNQFLQATHYTNLQPLWATDNKKKGNRDE